jgi:hypothetical protein
MGKVGAKSPRRRSKSRSRSRNRAKPKQMSRSGSRDRHRRKQSRDRSRSRKKNRSRSRSRKKGRSRSRSHRRKTGRSRSKSRSRRDQKRRASSLSTAARPDGERLALAAAILRAREIRADPTLAAAAALGQAGATARVDLPAPREKLEDADESDEEGNDWATKLTASNKKGGTTAAAKAIAAKAVAAAQTGHTKAAAVQHTKAAAVAAAVAANPKLRLARALPFPCIRLRYTRFSALVHGAYLTWTASGVLGWRRRDRRLQRRRRMTSTRCWMDTRTRRRGPSRTQRRGRRRWSSAKVPPRPGRRPPCAPSWVDALCPLNRGAALPVPPLELDPRNRCPCNWYGAR